MDAAARRRLLSWYRRRRRDLPWRRTGDPYAIWVSEVMLQQTRVDVATPYYERWMRLFPTVQALAEADEESVLEAWSGLGYYSRARNLHRAARAVVERHGGVLPRTAEGLQALPGVGPYTGGAVASIAFGEAVPAVDGNVVRVVSRFLGIRGRTDSASGRRRIQDAAAAWVAAAHGTGRGAGKAAGKEAGKEAKEEAGKAAGPGDWNQAVMELGATVCTPRAPDCGDCPVASACAARRLGIVHLVPTPKRRAKPRTERMEFAVIRHGGKVLLVRNPPGLLGGLWSLPGRAVNSEGTRGTLAQAVAEQTGVQVRLSGRVARAEHAFSHRTWAMRVRDGSVAAVGAVGAAVSLGAVGFLGAIGRASRRGAPPPREVRWVAVHDLDRVALPAAMRKALAAAAKPDLPRA